MNPIPENTTEARRYTRAGITIVKRSDRSGSKYSCRIKFRKVVHQITLAETVEESFKLAVAARREIHAGRWAELRSATGLRDRPTATLGQLETAYLASPVSAGPDTRKQNWHAFEQVLRTAGHDPVDTLRCSVLDNSVADAWFRAARERADASDDQEEQGTIRRSANSRWVQAASVFAPRAMAAYKLGKLHHAGMDSLVAAGELHRFVRLPKQQYHPPSDTVVADTLAAWEQLTDTDRDLYLILGHALAFGLRAREIIQARWGWWAERDGVPIIEGKASVKSGSAFVRVRALDPWYSAMGTRIAAAGWRGEVDDYIIRGHDTQRHDSVYRAASQWLRDHKWETQKTNHALRAYAGSQVAMRYGIYDAQTWLRHSSVTVTEQHYSYFVKQFRPADPAAMPARWATADRTFTPVLVLAVES